MVADISSLTHSDSRSLDSIILWAPICLSWGFLQLFVPCFICHVLTSFHRSAELVWCHNEGVRCAAPKEKWHRDWCLLGWILPAAGWWTSTRKLIGSHSISTAYFRLVCTQSVCQLNLWFLLINWQTKVLTALWVRYTGSAHTDVMWCRLVL